MKDVFTLPLILALLVMLFGVTATSAQEPASALVPLATLISIEAEGIEAAVEVEAEEIDLVTSWQIQNGPITVNYLAGRSRSGGAANLFLVAPS